MEGEEKKKRRTGKGNETNRQPPRIGPSLLIHGLFFLV
jgi:hypothetical protein